MRKHPLNLNDPVFVTKIANSGLGFVERGFISRLHDDYVEMVSVDSGGLVWAKRENVVTLEKMRELEAK